MPEVVWDVSKRSHASHLHGRTSGFSSTHFRRWRLPTTVELLAANVPPRVGNYLCGATWQDGAFAQVPRRMHKATVCCFHHDEIEYARKWPFCILWTLTLSDCGNPQRTLPPKIFCFLGHETINRAVVLSLITEI